jgi:probable rRNA maturation factor
MHVNIYNVYKKLSIDERKIVKLVKKILKGEGYKLNKLNIIITDNNHLKELNRKFLKKNRSTNVMAFNMDEVSEIYVSGEKVKNNEELYYYITHALLHIIGFEHRNSNENKLMEEKCFQYLSIL